MKAISFASSIVLAGALFVSAGAQAQESPYQLWQEDKTSPPVEDLYSQAAKFKMEVVDPVRLDDLADREEANYGGERSPEQLLADQNNALFSLLGTTYGGDGRTTFGLPDLRGRAPIHQGNNGTLGDMARGSEDILLEAQNPDSVSGLDVIPLQIRRRSEDRPQPTPEHEPLRLSGLELKKSDYYIKKARHRVSSEGYKTNFSVENSDI